MPGGSLVVVLQNDLLDQMRTRVVAPLIPAGSVDRVRTSLNPVIRVGTENHILMPQFAAALTLSEMGEQIGSLPHT